MATPNYGYEKRQRELAKKRKKEEKLKAKAERKVGGVQPPENEAADAADALPAADGDAQAPTPDQA